MKLSDFLIGLGIFALFSIIIFGAINVDNPQSIYAEGFLNVTHPDEKTRIAISNISTVGVSVDDNFQSIREDISKNESLGGELTEVNFFQSAWRTLRSIPKSYVPVINVLRMSEEKFGVPKQFTTWVLSSIVIIIGLMIAVAFLRNKLQS